MTFPDEAPYRHERLAPGSLQTPGTVHMHFHAGHDRVLQQSVIRELVQSGATPKETFILEDAAYRSIVSVPLGIKEELEHCGLPALRIYDDRNLQACEVELEYVLARHDAACGTRIADPLDPAGWLSARTGYVPRAGDIIHIHHSVLVPKKGSKAPITLEKLSAASNGLNISSWAMFAKPNAWCYRSSRTIHMKAEEALRDGEIEKRLRADQTKLGALFKSVGSRLEFSIVVEQLIARWDYPFERAANNRHRTTFKQLTGISEHQVPDVIEQYESAKKTERQPPAANPKNERDEAIRHLEPFRQMVAAQDLIPVVLGLGLIETVAVAEGMQFAEMCLMQAAAYAASRRDADALLRAYWNTIGFLLRCGYSPVLARPERSGRVAYWSSVLPAFSPDRQIVPPPLVADTVAADRRVFTITPVSQYKSFENAVTDELKSAMSRAQNPLVREAAVIGVPFQGPARADGSYLCGCLLGLVTASEFDERQFKLLASSMHVNMHFALFKSAPSSAVPLMRTPADDISAREDARTRQVKSHDRLWRALKAVFHEREGTRMLMMAKLYPCEYAIIQENEKLKALENETETATKLMPVVISVWTAMTGKSETTLYRWRLRTGLPRQRD